LRADQAYHVDAVPMLGTGKLDLRIARQPVGHLANFAHKGTLEWKRFILSELIAQTAQNS
jgi:hypothetical protein